MSPPPPETWKRKWSDRQVKDLLNIAKSLRMRGAPTDRAAWMAAEQSYKESDNPYLRRT
jgi:hypothetical protein